MHVMAVSRLERLFSCSRESRCRQGHLKRYSDFVDQELYDLLLIGQAAAKANGRDVIEPSICLSRGAAGSIHDFERMDEDVELTPILDDLATRPRSICPTASTPRPGCRPSSVA